LLLAGILGIFLEYFRNIKAGFTVIKKNEKEFDKMAWIFEKINEFKVLIYTQTPEGEIQLSKHKLLILGLYLSSFLLVFLHFASIPPEVIAECETAIALGEPCVIPSTRPLGIAALFYLYITMIAFVSIFKGGSIPNFISRPHFPSMRNRYKILLGISVVFFTGLLMFIIFLSVFFSGLLLLYTGPVLFIIWTFLEPFFLLSGILAIIRIIEKDYSLEGFSTHGKRILLPTLVVGYLTPLIFFYFLTLTSTSFEFSELVIFGFTISFYQPALASFSRTITSVLSISIFYLILWAIKDKLRGKSTLREKKKGMITLFLPLTILIIIVTVVPLIASTSGSLQEMTSIIDLLSLFAAVLMGLWNTLGVEKETGPVQGINKLNPLEHISHFHPYTKALFLLIISMFAFYSSIESSTVAVLTNTPDILKLQKLNLLAGFIGLAFLFILWRYKGEPRSTTPGLLKTTRKQIEEGILKIRTIVEKESSKPELPQQIPFTGEEE
jgi:MFS family permease